MELVTGSAASGWPGPDPAAAREPWFPRVSGRGGVCTVERFVSFVLSGGYDALARKQRFTPGHAVPTRSATAGCVLRGPGGRLGRGRRGQGGRPARSPSQEMGSWMAGGGPARRRGSQGPARRPPWGPGQWRGRAARRGAQPGRRRSQVREGRPPLGPLCGARFWLREPVLRGGGVPCGSVWCPRPVPSPAARGPPPPPRPLPEALCGDCAAVAPARAPGCPVAQAAGSGRPGHPAALELAAGPRGAGPSRATGARTRVRPVREAFARVQSLREPPKILVIEVTF